jgi:hypothetical protein
MNRRPIQTEALMERKERHTIMDGKVVEFAEGFTTGDVREAEGPYHVSASRNSVVVHYADLNRASRVSQFIEAVKAAAQEAEGMAIKDRYGNYWPDKIGPTPNRASPE